MSNKEGYPDKTADIAIGRVARQEKMAAKKKREEERNMESREPPKLKRVTRIDSIPAGSTYFNEQGFLHDTPIVTSTGIFEYGLPDGGVRRELRLPEHVFDKRSLASYAGKPVIITHDAGAIDKNNVMKEIVGTIISEGFQDGEDVRCKVVIHDIDKVKRTPYRELSLGYNLDLIEEPGEWNGEKYDAIQTNIRINHLAIVDKARAGEQSHLNLDGKKVELDDRKALKGGRRKMKKATRNDSVAMTPEELVEAINAYKSAKGGGSAEGAAAGDGISKEGSAVETPASPVGETPAASVEEPAVPTKTPEPEKEDGGEKDRLICALEELLSVLKGEAEVPAAESTDAADGVGCEPGEEEDNTDSSNDKSGSMNADAADDIFRQRLSICRMGDKLHMDGLEDKSILEGKKVIIAKVFPDMRMDGKSTVYIDAMYDLAVNEAGKRKNVNYQRQQMTGGSAPQQRADSAGGSMAATARQRMIEREGGNE